MVYCCRAKHVCETQAHPTGGTVINWHRNKTHSALTIARTTIAHTVRLIATLMQHHQRTYTTTRPSIYCTKHTCTKTHKRRHTGTHTQIATHMQCPQRSLHVFRHIAQATIFVCSILLLLFYGKPVLYMIKILNRAPLCSKGGGVCVCLCTCECTSQAC